ncbi:MAG: polyprenyl synthetase family protein [Alphaproteobacteria bacterium]|nr:polyprenyl synthetase family protein [Alphaproteobacteria bacterium]
MHYAVMGGGKRIRPFLVLASSRLFNVSEVSALRTAAAIEMIHCYSLVHDDLPAMDNSDLRRGQPTLHKKFDEATAILAGDALLTLAFEILAHPETHSDSQVRSELIISMAKASGAAGMVGGQMLDLQAEKDSSLDIGSIIRLQRLKTGAIIAFACESGAILGHAPQAARQALHAYAHNLGLAFQIADDLLDTEGDQDTVGKSVGRDAVAGKATFVSILGVERARTQAYLLARQAKNYLEPFGEKAHLLQAMADFVVKRRH